MVRSACRRWLRICSDSRMVLFQSPGRYDDHQREQAVISAIVLTKHVIRSEESATSSVPVSAAGSRLPGHAPLISVVTAAALMPAMTNARRPW